MGLGMITDLVLAEATEFIVAPAVFLHPLAGLKFAVAPGLIFTKDIETSTKGDGIHGAPFLAKSEGNHNPSPLMVRLGLAYDIHLGKTSLSPTLNADLIHKHWSLAFRGAQDLTAQLSVKDEPLSTKDQKIEPLQSVSQ